MDLVCPCSARLMASSLFIWYLSEILVGLFVFVLCGKVGGLSIFMYFTHFFSSCIAKLLYHLILMFSLHNLFCSAVFVVHLQKAYDSEPSVYFHMPAVLTAQFITYALTKLQIFTSFCARVAMSEIKVQLLLGSVANILKI